MTAGSGETGCEVSFPLSIANAIARGPRGWHKGHKPRAADIICEDKMEIRQISDNYSVSGQIEAADVPAIKAAGFRSVICNRPDDEQPGQPAHDAIKAAVEAAGLTFRYIPVISGQMTAENVSDQEAALDELEGPVFAYCRSGARCTNLYALVQERKRS